MKVKLWLLLSFLLTGCFGTQTPAPSINYGAQKGAGSAGMHTVLSGDTVYNVSKHYQLPMRDIIVLNHLSPPYRLNVGYRMKLPPPNEYTVQDGDTLYGVGKIFDVSVNRLVKLNNLRAPYTISKGQVLRLPSPQGQAVKKQQVSMTTRAASPKNARSQNTMPEPSKKPSVQKASVKRPKIPSKVPKRSGNGKFMQPVDGKVLSSYGPKKGGLHNDGVNIKAPRGAPVRAAENGVVVYTGSELEGYGNLVLVRHEGRWMSAYAHLDKTLIKRGDTVRRGQSLGTVGSSGQVSSPQLHFELRRGTKAVNPQKYL